MRQKKYYKLVKQDMTSYGGCKWKIEEWKEATGKADQPLCTDGWLHCYSSPLLAILHNPIHASIKDPRLFEVEVSGKTKDDSGTQRGFCKMRLVRELSLPAVTQEQRIRYGILCAKAIYRDAKFVVRVDSWLSSEDRSKTAAWAAQAATQAATWSAACSGKEMDLDKIAEKAMGD